MSYPWTLKLVPTAPFPVGFLSLKQSFSNKINSGPRFIIGHYNTTQVTLQWNAEHCGTMRLLAQLEDSLGHDLSCCTIFAVPVPFQPKHTRLLRGAGRCNRVIHSSSSLQPRTILLVSPQAPGNQCCQPLG